VDRCVVLNGDYTFLNTVDWKRAVALFMKGKTEVLKFSERPIRNGAGKVVMKVPLVMRLIKFIRSIYKSRVPFTKKNVFVRDKFRCAYCGAKDILTIDHVIPVSRGGKTTFDNCVASCKSCNSNKGNRIPSEANMFLKKQPYSPTISEFIRLKMEQLGLDQILVDIGVY